MKWNLRVCAVCLARAMALLLLLPVLLRS